MWIVAVLQPGVLHEMILEANRTLHLPSPIPSRASNHTVDACSSGMLTDSLGFYLEREHHAQGGTMSPGAGDMMQSAAEYKRKADDILHQQSLVG
jgi:hypothetical protein